MCVFVYVCVRNLSSEFEANVTVTSVVISVDGPGYYNASVSSWTRLGDGGILIYITFSTSESGKQTHPHMHRCPFTHPPACTPYAQAHILRFRQKYDFLSEGFVEMFICTCMWTCLMVVCTCVSFCMQCLQTLPRMCHTHCYPPEQYGWIGPPPHSPTVSYNTTLSTTAIILLSLPRCVHT